MTSPFAGRRVRQALLGAVALGVLGGAIVTHDGFEASRALADTAQTQAGPASFADVVDRVKSSVVSIKVKMSDGGDADSDDQDSGPRPHHGMPQLPPGSPFEHFFRQFGSPEDGDGPRHPHVGMAQGSGFFISGDGYIVTNNHVVDHATEVNVTTADGKTIPAKVIGTDPKTDLALLKVKGDSFPYVSFAEKAPRVGDWVIAVGNPFGLGGTVTAGIVSARGRDIGSGPYDDFLQIDAPVNHGNSGGPTFNSQGQVVGVNTAIFSPSGGSVGIGFAISSDVVKSVVAQRTPAWSNAAGWASKSSRSPRISPTASA
jgi:serine protease Do